MSLITESQIQSAFFEACRADMELSHCWMHAIPNGTKKTIAGAVRFQKEGLVSGIADVFIPVARGGYFGFYIEFKRPGGKLSKNQVSFHHHAVSNGYKFEIFYDSISAYYSVKKYMGLSYTKAIDQVRITG